MTEVSEVIRTKFPNRKIIVIGDLVADQFLHGAISRVSREAPVFILRHEQTQTMPGGAANAAVNVASLGGRAVLIGVVGRDLNGACLLEELEKSKVDCDSVIVSDKFRTTTKVRILAGQRHTQRQQVVRIDYENAENLAAEVYVELEKKFLIAVEDADAVIISDYNYGVLTKNFAEFIIKTAKARRVPVIVDSRFRLEIFRGATSATPNQEEVEYILGENFGEKDCAELRERLGYESLLVTRGNNGMMLVKDGAKTLHIEAVGEKEPVDVTGAGDTVIAVYALGLACGLSFDESANLANHAGGIVVMKKGTASTNAGELSASLVKFASPKSRARTK